MRVSYEWLKTMVDLPDDPAELAAEYIRTGTEVEAVETIGSSFDHVVTGVVLEKRPHPDSDHMWVTKVGVGNANLDAQGNPAPLQVVCGAQNFEEGDHIVVAMVGAELPGDIKIKKSKLRGVESCGMNCSKRELGMGSDHSGIWILPPDAPVGMPLGQYTGDTDVVLDCEITPNRPDCLSMWGMARETGAVLGREVAYEYHELAEEGPDVRSLVDVRIDDPELCQRYVARVISGVKIGPSPDWLAKRVVAAGSRPINNVVDVTNYVMYLTGQPLHAFDLGKLTKDADGVAHIVVRAAHDGEKLTTLDGKERELTSDMALITDNGVTPVGLAGVMGGLDSEIDDTTVDVLLESAAFSNGHISRTSRNLQLFSEAAMRYERIVDAQGCGRVSDLAAALFAQVCGGTVATGAVDVYPAPAAQPRLTLRCERLRAMMGAPIDDEFITASLERLGCEVEQAAPGELAVVPPSFRPDLPREIDLYEEVVRLWGEGDIEATLPAARNHRGGLTPEQRLLRKVGATLRACSLNETICYNFVAEDDLERLGMSEEGRGIPVRLMRPMSSDWTVMRRSLIPGLLRSVANNQKRGVKNVALYETGRLYFGRPGKAQPKERAYVAGVLAGKWDEDGWNCARPELDFFDGKGVVERLLAALRIEKVRWRAADPAAYAFAQPGCVAEVLAGGAVLGWVGELHPRSLANFDVEAPVVAFELDLEQLLKLASSKIAYKDVPTLPAVTMDLAITVDEDVTCERLEQVMTSAAGKNLESLRLFDVYRDPVRVGAGKKSMAFALAYRAEGRTMTSEEAEAVHKRVVEKTCRATGGTVRGM